MRVQQHDDNDMDLPHVEADRKVQQFFSKPKSPIIYFRNGCLMVRAMRVARTLAYLRVSKKGVSFCSHRNGARKVSAVAIRQVWPGVTSLVDFKVPALGFRV